MESWPRVLYFKKTDLFLSPVFNILQINTIGNVF